MMNEGWFETMTAAQRVAAEAARTRRPPQAHQSPTLAAAPQLLLPRGGQMIGPIVPGAPQTSPTVPQLAVEQTSRRAPQHVLPGVAAPIRQPIPQTNDRPVMPSMVVRTKVRSPAPAPFIATARSALRSEPPQLRPLAIARTPSTPPTSLPHTPAKPLRLQPLAPLSPDIAEHRSPALSTIAQPKRISSIENLDSATLATAVAGAKRNALADSAAGQAAFSTPHAAAWDTEAYYRELEQLRLDRQREAVLGEL